MKKKKPILIAVMLSLLIAYVTLYFANVSPDGKGDTEANIVLWSGWSPYYQKLEYRNASSKAEQRWNTFIHGFFAPIHKVDQVLRPDLWLSAKEKQDKIYRSTRCWSLEAPLQIYNSGIVMDGGSIRIGGVDNRLTEFHITLDRSIRTRRENLPEYVWINGRNLEFGGSEEEQLAIDLNEWLENASDKYLKSNIGHVKEVIRAISNRT